MTGLMEDVKVIESGVLMTVDYLGRLLGDEGADVIKIESPQLGDYLRNIMTRFGPEWSVFHMILNRNKRSVTCDARTPEGQEILAKLLADADAFITGNVGDTNRKLGLDYESITKIKPDIVYCQATGFGATGPYAEVPTHGQMMDALGGGAAPMGLDERGFVVANGAPPRGSGGVVLGPLYAAFAVAAALARAQRTGEGCYIDVSCADAVIAGNWTGALAALNPDKIDTSEPSAGGPVGGAETGSAKYQHYETKDGKYMLFCAIETKFWENWCRAVGREDLLGEHRTDLVVDFGGDGNLRAEIQKVFHGRTQEQWMELAVEHDVPMGPALSFDEIRDDPHLRVRNQVVTEHHPVFGDILTLGNPILVPGKELTITSAPSHGQHTDEVLAAVGYDEEARAHLRTRGVIK